MQAVQALAEQADVVAAQLADGPARRRRRRASSSRSLQAQGVDVVLLRRAGTGTGPVGTARRRGGAPGGSRGGACRCSASVDGRRAARTLVEARTDARTARSRWYAGRTTGRWAPACAAATSCSRWASGLLVAARRRVGARHGCWPGRCAARPRSRARPELHGAAGRAGAACRGPARWPRSAGAVNDARRRAGPQRGPAAGVPAVGVARAAHAADRRARLRRVAGRRRGHRATRRPRAGRTSAGGGAAGPAGRATCWSWPGWSADDFRLDLAEVDLAGGGGRRRGVAGPVRGGGGGVALVPPHPTVRADPRRLRQVVDGLAENALRVTPAGDPSCWRCGTCCKCVTARGCAKRSSSGVPEGCPVREVRAVAVSGCRVGAGARPGGVRLGGTRSRPVPHAEGGAR